MDQRTKGIALVAVNVIILGLILFAVVKGPIGGRAPDQAQATTRARPAASEPTEAQGGHRGRAKKTAAIMPHETTVTGAPSLASAGDGVALSGVGGAPLRRGAAAASHIIPAGFDDNARGVRLFEEGRYGEACAAFETALDAAPADTAIRSNLAYALANAALETAKAGGTARLDEALARADRALSLAPGVSEFHRVVGEIRFLRGDLRAARDAFLTASIDQPSNPLIERYLGEIAYREERLPEALKRYRRAALLGDKDPRLAEKIRKVEREAGVEEEMEVFTGRHFIVKSDAGVAGSAGEAELVLRKLEVIRDRVERELDAVPKRPVAVVLYDGEQFRGATGVHAWTGGLFDGKIRIPIRGLDVDGAAAEQLLTHEYAHALVAEVASGGAPAWLDEGIAQHLAGEWSDGRSRLASERLRAHGILPFESLEASFSRIASQDDAERAYFQAYLAVDYLTFRYGPRELKAILDALGGGASGASALESVCRIDYRRLADLVAEHNARKFPDF
jgi:Flp pilus assembly protein TadD